MSEPGVFGWVSDLFRWSGTDHSVQGQGGPLPPPRAALTDTTDLVGGKDTYQGFLESWQHTTTGAALTSFFSEPRTRKELYILYEKMDMTDIAAAFLDSLSEDATEVDPHVRRRVWTTGPDAIVAANDMLFKRLGIDDHCTAHARDLAKLGDLMDRYVYRSGLEGGIQRMIPIMPLAVTRMEDKDGKLTGYKQVGRKFRNDNSDLSYPWDFSHFRLMGRDRRFPYGMSLLYNGIRPWRYFVMLDDWAVSNTLARGTDRNLIMFDVGSASEPEAAAGARQLANRLRRYVGIDPTGTGSAASQYMQQRPRPVTPTDDIILPVRGESRTSVSKLYGSHGTIDMVPLTFMIRRFFSAVRAPQEFFGYIDNPAALQNINPKATLCDQDIRYMRQTRRVQHALKQGYRYTCELNLRLLRAPGDRTNPEVAPEELSALDNSLEGNDFEVHMAQISFLDELRALEVEQTRQQVALGMMEMGLNNPAVDIFRFTNYIFREIVKVPDDELLGMIRDDLSMEHLDNLGMGLTPEGDPIPDNPKTKTEAAMVNRTKLALRIRERMEARKDKGAATDAALNNGEKKVLSEVISRNPALRDLINKSRAIHHTDTDIPRTSALPDNELIRKGMLKDNITESEVKQMIEESYNETGIRPVGYDD